MLENLDVLMPNRLILGCNNNRSTSSPLEIAKDLRHIIERNNEIFQVWFKEWITIYVPQLIDKPKWFVTERNLSIGDIVLFLKNEQEFDRQYQYGIVKSIIEGRDQIVTSVFVEYQNPGENAKHCTKRGVHDLVVIHPIEEIGISKELEPLVQF